MFPLLVKAAAPGFDVVVPSQTCAPDTPSCLASMAQSANTPYAVMLVLERALKRGEWHISALVVRPNGEVAVRLEAAFTDKKTAPFSELAANELTKVLTDVRFENLTPQKVAPAPVAETPVAPPPAIVEQTPEPTGSSGGLRMTSYIVGGLGLVGLASGVVFTVLANSDLTAIKSSLVQANGMAIGIPPSSKPLAQRLDVESNGALACYIAGGVLLAAGVVMFALSAEDAPAVSWVPLRGGGAAVFSGRF
ncbi:MAG: hypothetical protein QM723_29400 [Myxococcaceae bacterium]